VLSDEQVEEAKYMNRGEHRKWTRV